MSRMVKLLSTAAFLVWTGGIVPAYAQPKTPLSASVIGGNATLAVTTATARVALPSSVTTFPVVMLLNDGAAEVFVAVGTVAVVATTASIPIPPGKAIAFPVSSTTGYVAAITSATTSTLQVIQWNGQPWYQ